MLLFKIPYHKNQLRKASQTLTAIEEAYQKYKKKKQLTEEVKEKLIFECNKVLYFLGDLSMPIFKLRTIMEKEYFDQYKSSPKLAKSLYLKEYQKLHKPYDALKNKAFKLLDLINPPDKNP